MLCALALALTADQPLFVEHALPGVTTVCGDATKDFIIEVNGGGVALADFDLDGVLDLIVVDGSTVERAAAGPEESRPGNPPRLFMGKGDGTFSPATGAWGMEGGRWGMGCAVGDVNGDGCPDLFVTEWGPDRLFLNDAGKGFTEVTEKSGLVGSRWGASAAFLDYDSDGHLDLVVVNYLDFDYDELVALGPCAWKGHDVMCGPEGRLPVKDQLYRGRGDGTFEDVTVAMRFLPDEVGFGLGVVTLDYDLDGDTDIYITNDSTPNHLWENNVDEKGKRSFLERGSRRAVDRDSNGKEQAGMGIACGDVNGDGREDLFCTNFSGESNALYVSSSKTSFRERGDAYKLGGASKRSLGWGTGLGDFDLDGDLDLFVLNGHVYPAADAAGMDTSYAQADHFFRQEPPLAGKKRARFLSEPLSAAGPGVSRASTFGDLDRDGDLDIVALDLGGAVRILINQTVQGEEAEKHVANGLVVGLRAEGANTFALGARVRAEWAGGTRAAEVRTSGGFQAALPAEVHFGLGGAAKVERLTITWPSGAQQVEVDVPATTGTGKIHIVEEGGE